jgi:hypothetical protein
MQEGESQVPKRTRQKPRSKTRLKQNRARLKNLHQPMLKRKTVKKMGRWSRKIQAKSQNQERRETPKGTKTQKALIRMNTLQTVSMRIRLLTKIKNTTKTKKSKKGGIKIKAKSRIRKDKKIRPTSLKKVLLR